jgi:hypothetical protein
MSIDYGRNTNANRCAKGIRFGIISSNHESLSEHIWDLIEPEYIARCPKCGSDSMDLDDERIAHEELDDYEQAEYDTIEFACKRCSFLYGESGYGDEPDGNNICTGEESGFLDSHGDLWITKSKYVTRGTHCSPCAPGAVTISSHDPDGPLAYCLGPNWFDGDPPYLIEQVLNNG